MRDEKGYVVGYNRGLHAHLDGGNGDGSRDWDDGTEATRAEYWRGWHDGAAVARPRVEGMGEC